jgi:hypothetical protein
MLTLEAESWVWYGVVWLIVLARMVSRRMLLGSFKRFQIDDYLVLLAMATHTVFIYFLLVVDNTPNNLIDPNNPEDNVAFTPENIQERIRGSKAIFVVEQMQCCTIWIIKACILLMYYRITINTEQRFLVKIAAVYTTVCFIIMETLCFAAWCRPFSQYWAIHPANTQCATYLNHLITNLVVNLSSDLLIFFIPFPLFFRSSLDLKQKLVLSCIFAVGIFTMVCAILSKTYSFIDPFSNNWTYWYVRESSTAIICANLPPTWPLIRKVFAIKSPNSTKANYYARSARPINVH